VSVVLSKIAMKWRFHKHVLRSLQTQRHVSLPFLKFFDVRNGFFYVGMTFLFSRFFHFMLVVTPFFKQRPLWEAEASHPYTEDFDGMSTLGIALNGARNYGELVLSE